MATPATILIVDDQTSFRFMLQQQLQNEFAVVSAAGVAEALTLLQQHRTVRLHTY